MGMGGSRLNYMATLRFRWLRKIHGAGHAPIVLDWVLRVGTQASSPVLVSARLDRFNAGHGGRDDR